MSVEEFETVSQRKLVLSARGDASGCFSLSFLSCSTDVR